MTSATPFVRARAELFWQGDIMDLNTLTSYSFRSRQIELSQEPASTPHLTLLPSEMTLEVVLLLNPIPLRLQIVDAMCVRATSSPACWMTPKILSTSLRNLVQEKTRPLWQNVVHQQV